MAVCELCGKGDALFTAMVEGSELSVCEKCGKFGKLVKKPVLSPSISGVKGVKVEKPEIVEVVVSDYARIIREAREKLGLTQADFAKKIAEKESLVHKMENGFFTPPLVMAKKLEHLLRIKLVVIEEEEKVALRKDKNGPLTIGDVINVKK